MSEPINTTELRALWINGVIHPGAVLPLQDDRDKLRDAMHENFPRLLDEVDRLRAVASRQPADAARDGSEQGG